jgi:tRNA threonylcarbamoyladenosine biosynthesis protein TsaB
VAFADFVRFVVIICQAMLVLALDTTTTVLSCAVARDGVVLYEDVHEGRAHARRLPGALMALLSSAGLTLPEIDVFAVATGPGSFTGLRIGIATMQGLAFAAGKPLVGVSGLDALARIAFRVADVATVATWVDAWRGEVYAALYRDAREAEPPRVARPDDLLRRLVGTRVLFIGDGARTFSALILQTLGASARIADPPAPALAGAIAEIAAAERDLPPPHAIRPLYVRRPDAELARAREG